MANIDQIAAQFTVSVDAINDAILESGLIFRDDYSANDVVIIGQHLTGSTPTAQPAASPTDASGHQQPTQPADCSADASGSIAFLGNVGAAANNIAVQQQAAIAAQIVNTVAQNAADSGRVFASHIYNTAWAAFADGVNQQLAALHQTGDARPNAVHDGLYHRPQFAPVPRPQLSDQTRKQLFLDAGDDA